MAHHTSLIVEDYSGDSLVATVFDGSKDTDTPGPDMVRLKMPEGSIVMLTTDDALALATWLTDWVVDQQKKGAVTS